MRKLFVSFTSLVGALKEGRVTEVDLATGLFHLGCCRSHALDPWKHRDNEVLWHFKDDIEQGRAVHNQIVSAIIKGEREGRVSWRHPEEHRTYTTLNRLLVRHGVGKISCGLDIKHYSTMTYCYPGVEERVKDAGLQIEVIR